MKKKLNLETKIIGNLSSSANKKPNLKSINQIFEEVTNNKRLKRNIILWVGSRAGDYKNIDFIGPRGAIATRFGKDTVKIAEQYDLFSVEQVTKTREDSGMEQLDPFLRKFISSYENNPLAIIAYHSTENLENLAKEFKNVKLLNPSYELKEKLDEKNFTREELNKRGVKTIPCYNSIVSSEDFETAKEKFGLPFFLQLNKAWSGFGSFVVSDKKEFENIVKHNKGKKVSYMPLLKDTKSLNINAVKTANYNVFTGLSFQIIGDPNCINKDFGYCGNDFNVSERLSKEEISKSRKIIEGVGNWLGELGYKGTYGVDLISDGKEVYFTEINPRFQGSTSLLIDQQIEQNKIPLTMFHFAAYLRGFSLAPKSLNRYNKLETDLNVSQILLHNLSGEDVNLVSSPEPGRYIFEKNKIKYLGPANFLSERESDKEFILAGDVPLNGTRVLGESDEICKIFLKGSVLNENCRTLNDYAQSIAKEVYSKFIFEK